MSAPSHIPCASCGNPLPIGARFCNVCGAGQPAPEQAAPAPRPKFGAMTVVGVASPLSQPQPQPQQVAPPQPQQQPIQPQQPLPKKPFAGTMIGVAMPEMPKQAPQPPQQPQLGARNIPKGTLVGVALPGVAPTHAKPLAPGEKPPAPPGWTPPPGPPLGASQPPPPQPRYQLPPGSPYAQQQPSPAFAPPPAWQPADAQGEAEEALPPAKKPSRAPVFVLLALALIGIAVALFFVLRPGGPPPLTSQVKGDASAPKLVVGCESCADGSTFQLGDASAEFASHEASVPLPSSSLKAGKNVLKGSLTPKGKKAVDVELEVVVPYLAQTSLASLEKGEVDLIFDLAPDAKGVEVDGKTVKGSGKQTVPIAIPAATDETRSFERTVKFKVLGDTPIEGSLKLSIPYATLRIGLPGKHAIAFGDSIEISGRTSPSAIVTVGDTKLTADAQGIFKGKTIVAKDATTLVVRALSSKLAPREVTVQLAHAESIEDATKALRGEAKLTFDKISGEADKHVGEVAVVKVEIAQVGEEDGRTVAVGESRCPAAAQGNTCPVVRILVPSGVTVSKGKVVEVLGTITRAVPLEKGTAVEIDGAVLLDAK